MNNTITDPYLISGAAGLLAAVFLLVFLNRRKIFSPGHMALCYIFGAAGMFIGAHLLFFLVGLPDFSEKYGASVYDIQSFLTAVFNASSGMVYYGGLFGGIGGIALLCRLSHVPLRECLNMCACTFPLIHGFGRIGCWLGGCCYGVEYHGILAVHYTEAHINPGISDQIAQCPRFPVQPLEAVLEFAICFLLVMLYEHTFNRFSLTAVYLFAYGIVRFFDEFLRGDAVRGFWGPFSTSQWIALACIIGTGIFYFTRHRAKNTG